MQKELSRIKTAVAQQQTQVTAGSQIELDDNMTRRLRALGYIDKKVGRRQFIST